MVRALVHDRPRPGPLDPERLAFVDSRASRGSTCSRGPVVFFTKNSGTMTYRRASGLVVFRFRAGADTHAERGLTKVDLGSRTPCCGRGAEDEGGSLRLPGALLAGHPDEVNRRRCRRPRRTASRRSSWRPSRGARRRGGNHRRRGLALWPALRSRRLSERAARRGGGASGGGAAAASPAVSLLVLLRLLVVAGC